MNVPLWEPHDSVRVERRDDRSVFLVRRVQSNEAVIAGLMGAVIAYVLWLTTSGWVRDLGAGYRALTLYITASAGEVWEVDFHDDGTVDVERFITTGIEEEEANLDSLLAEMRSDRNDSTVS